MFNQKLLLNLLIIVFLTFVPTLKGAEPKEGKEKLALEDSPVNKRKRPNPDQSIPKKKKRLKAATEGEGNSEGEKNEKESKIEEVGKKKEKKARASAKNLDPKEKEHIREKGVIKERRTTDGRYIPIRVAEIRDVTYYYCGVDHSQEGYYGTDESNINRHIKTYHENKSRERHLAKDLKDEDKKLIRENGAIEKLKTKDGKVISIRVAEIRGVKYFYCGFDHPEEGHYGVANERKLIKKHVETHSENKSRGHHLETHRENKILKKLLKPVSEGEENDENEKESKAEAVGKKTEKKVKESAKNLKDEDKEYIREKGVKGDKTIDGKVVPIRIATIRGVKYYHCGGDHPKGDHYGVVATTGDINRHLKTHVKKTEKKVRASAKNLDPKDKKFIREKGKIKYEKTLDGKDIPVRTAIIRGIKYYNCGGDHPEGEYYGVAEEEYNIIRHVKTHGKKRLNAASEGEEDNENEKESKEEAVSKKTGKKVRASAKNLDEKDKKLIREKGKITEMETIDGKVIPIRVSTIRGVKYFYCEGDHDRIEFFGVANESNINRYLKTHSGKKEKNIHSFLEDKGKEYIKNKGKSFLKENINGKKVHILRAIFKGRSVYRCASCALHDGKDHFGFNEHISYHLKGHREKNKIKAMRIITTEEKAEAKSGLVERTVNLAGEIITIKTKTGRATNVVFYCDGHDEEFYGLAERKRNIDDHLRRWHGYQDKKEKKVKDKEIKENKEDVENVPITDSNNNGALETVSKKDSKEEAEQSGNILNNIESESSVEQVFQIPTPDELPDGAPPIVDPPDEDYLGTSSSSSIPEPSADASSSDLSPYMGTSVSSEVEPESEINVRDLTELEKIKRKAEQKKLSKEAKENAKLLPHHSAEINDIIVVISYYKIKNKIVKLVESKDDLSKCIVIKIVKYKDTYVCECGCFGHRVHSAEHLRTHESSKDNTSKCYKCKRSSYHKPTALTRHYKERHKAISKFDNDIFNKAEIEYNRKLTEVKGRIASVSRAAILPPVIVSNVIEPKTDNMMPAGFTPVGAGVSLVLTADLTPNPVLTPGAYLTPDACLTPDPSLTPDASSSSISGLSSQHYEIPPEIVRHAFAMANAASQSSLISPDSYLHHLRQLMAINLSAHHFASTHREPVISDISSMPKIIAAKDLRLLEACQANNDSDIKKSIEEKADPNVRNKFGDTPLILLAKHHNLPMIILLLLNNADPNIMDNQGKIYKNYLTFDEVKHIEDEISVLTLLR